MKLSKKFYVIPWGSSFFVDESDSVKESLRNIFKGFDTKEEAEKYASSLNEEFKSEYASEDDYYNDLGSKEAMIVERKEVSEYLDSNFKYLDENFEN